MVIGAAGLDEGRDRPTRFIALSPGKRGEITRPDGACGDMMRWV